jgi:hypothetical protein
MIIPLSSKAMKYDEQRNPAMVRNTLSDRIILQPEDFGRHFDDFKTILGSNLLCNSAADKDWLGCRDRHHHQLRITRMSEFPDVYGGFSDVYRGAYLETPERSGGHDSQETNVVRSLMESVDSLIY